MKFVSSSILLAFAACSAPPSGAPRDAAPLPTSFSATSASASTEVPANTADLARFWSAFGDARLERLIQRALDGNLDLARAAARVREARARLAIEDAADAPTLDANGGYTRSRRSRNSTNGAPFFGQRDTDLFDVGFDARWEVDLFGAIDARVDAARADLAAARVGRDAVRVTLAAEVARNYVELAGARARLAVARESVAIQEDTAGLVRERERAGLANSLDAARADALVATSRATLPAFESAAAERVHRLSLLIGAEPRELEAELADTPSIPLPNAKLVIEAPLAVLARRPDLARAELELAAADARVAAARADLWPRLSLGASLGFVSNDADTLLRGSSIAGSVGPSLVAPIFEGGRLRAAVEVADARADDAWLAWRASVLSALAEVEDSLASLSAASTRERALADAVEQQSRAASIARDLYTAGLVDFLSVVDAERARFAAEDQLAENRTALSVRFIALAKSLGGGWDANGSETK